MQLPNSFFDVPVSSQSFVNNNIPMVGSDVYLDSNSNFETGSVVDDGSVSSAAEQARDDNLGFFNQLLGSLNGYNQKILQDLQKQAAEYQYSYLERMSNSAYQRAVADMRKAGLNPAVIFANGASSASTPNVQQYSVAQENQLLSFFSSAGMLFSGIGSLLNSILPSKVISNSTSNVTSNIFKHYGK